MIAAIKFIKWLFIVAGFAVYLAGLIFFWPSCLLFGMTFLAIGFLLCPQLIRALINKIN